MKGNPKFQLNQRVKFTIDNQMLEGIIHIIDAFGTFDYDEDVSYDIFVEGENCLYKHIPEKYVEEVTMPMYDIKYPQFGEFKKESKKESSVIPMTRDTFAKFAFAACKSLIEREEMDNEFDELLRKYNRCGMSDCCAFDLFGNYEPVLIDTLIEIMKDDDCIILDYIFGVASEDMDDEEIRQDLEGLYDELIVKNFK